MSLILADNGIGIFKDMPAADYHATRALSASALPHLAKSPAHLIAYWENPPEQTADMRMGSAIHGIKHGDTQVLRCDVASRNNKEYKEAVKANPGAIILLADEYENAKRVVEALDKHPRVREIYKGGTAEVSAFWRCPDSGIACKARADFLRDDGLIVDLKTTKDASPEAFKRAIAERRYHYQSAHYLDGFGLLMGKELKNFVHVVVEKEPPYGIGIYVLGDASLEKAREDIRRLKARYLECLHTGEFPGYSDEIQNIEVPAWAFSVEVA